MYIRFIGRAASMKILLTTHNLKYFTGAELNILDFAKQLKKFGHEITVATFVYDYPLKKYFEECKIKVFNVLLLDMDEIEFDLIWSQHTPVLYHIIFEKKVQAKYIFFNSLSSFDPLEVPPIFANELTLCLANSEETKEHISELRIIEEKKVKVFVNSVTEDFYEKYDTNKKCTLRNIAIISNHVPEELKKCIDLLVQANINVDKIGMENKFVLVTHRLLAHYDAVITIGRTVQQCFAAGIPVYCYDRFGGPGWLTRYNVLRSEHFNFSGRCCRRKLLGQEIYEEILNGFNDTFNDRSYLNEFALSRYSLNKNLLDALEIISNSKCVSFMEIFKFSYINEHNKYYIRELKNNSKVFKKTSKLFLDFGNDFSEENSLIKDLNIIEKRFTLSYEIPSRMRKPVKKIRWDPIENSFCITKIEEAYIIDNLNRRVDLDIKNVESNGTYREGFIFFDTFDPMLYFKVDQEEFTNFYLSGKCIVLDNTQIEDRIKAVKEKIKSIGQPEFQMQIFIPISGEYSEDDSLLNNGVADGSDVCLAYQVTPFKCGCLRIDPTNCPAYVEIKEIRVVEVDDSNNESTILSCTSANSYEGLSIARGAYKIKNEEIYSLVCFDNDPQLFLNIASNISKSVRLYCQLSVVKLDSKLIVSGIKKIIDYIDSLHSENDRVVKDKDLLIIEQKIQLNNFLFKLESQINIIKSKDLLLKENELQIQLLQEMIVKVKQTEEQLSKILNSHVWKITAPFRKAGNIIKSILKIV